MTDYEQLERDIHTKLSDRDRWYIVAEALSRVNDLVVYAKEEGRNEVRRSRLETILDDVIEDSKMMLLVAEQQGSGRRDADKHAVIFSENEGSFTCACGVFVKCKTFNYLGRIEWEPKGQALANHIQEARGVSS